MHTFRNTDPNRMAEAAIFVMCAQRGKVVPEFRMTRNYK